MRQKGIQSNRKLEEKLSTLRLAVGSPATITSDLKIGSINHNSSVFKQESGAVHNMSIEFKDRKSGSI